MITYILIGTAVLIVGYLVSTYNFFATAKTRVAAAIQEIANQLKRQVELIPNLEASAKGYLKHEKGIFDELSSARKLASEASRSTDPQKMMDAAKAVNDVMPSLKILVESNPELKGNTVVTNLMEDLRDTSDKVMYSRRLFIDLTADYNVKRVTFPSNLVANMFGFGALQGFDIDIDSEDLKTPKITL